MLDVGADHHCLLSLTLTILHPSSWCDLQLVDGKKLGSKQPAHHDRIGGRSRIKLGEEQDYYELLPLVRAGQQPTTAQCAA